MSTRAENERRARVLRDQGWLLREIAAEMGVALSTVNEWLNDPGGVRLAARKASYGAPCVDCGAATNGTQRCLACSRRHQHEQARWTRETVIEALRQFERRYGRAPAATDFNPNMARRLGHESRADRFYADGCYPHVVTVRQVFGTWNEALDAAGLPRNQNHRRRRVAA